MKCWWQREEILSSVEDLAAGGLFALHLTDLFSHYAEPSSSLQVVTFVSQVLFFSRHLYMLDGVIADVS